MSKIIVAAFTIVAVIAFGFEASAQSKKCPDGYYYDEEIGKCVKRRGSY